MDEANNRLGNLSLRAAEWKPSTLASNVVDNDGNSDLNAGTVKEFIPGQGWTASAASGASVQAAETRGGFDDSLSFHFCFRAAMNLIHLSNLPMFSNTGNYKRESGRETL